jgi:hypothetical protein
LVVFGVVVAMSESLEDLVKAALKSREDKQRRADYEAIGHLDFRFVPQCQCVRTVTQGGRRTGCDREAQWRMFCRGCGFLAFVCHVCRTDLLNLPHMSRCLRCNQKALVLSGWTFEPLGSAS